ncbi:hypothetical protein DXT76_13590 [Halobacillus trueperi]|uniref:Uncharacterized protein n=1 Tax=Halobacillus trueperi TaxID=156205 RepID=A0A3D8VM54_9BACI|nr:hypothetical protein DXT76_13590 [Halobacillus trueperi]
MSNDWVPNHYGTLVGRGLVEREATPQAVLYFDEMKEGLHDYDYWFFLSTIWVSYSGWSDLNLWKKLFSSNRPNKKTSIMKPSELKAFRKMPNMILAYRAHRPNETDWISYTLEKQTAERFARERGVTSIHRYLIKKSDVCALFLRRGEDEILVIDKDKVTLKEEIPLSEEDKNAHI